MGVMQHVHYGDWTIEWEPGDYGAYEFYISTQQRESIVMRVEVHRYWVMTSVHIESCIQECRALILEITDRQRRVMRAAIWAFHYDRRPPSPQTEPLVSEQEQADTIPF